MEMYCYGCRKEAKEELCERCRGAALPIAPRESGPGKGVEVALLPNELGAPEKVFSCRLQIGFPEEWGRRDLREVGACTDRFMGYRHCEMSWRYDARSGRLHLLGRRSEGRCEWCAAFRKNLQNMAREEGRPFRSDGACPIA